MPTRSRPPLRRPRSLFDLPPSTPTWDTIPEATRQQAIEILSQMIRQLRAVRPEATDAQEVADE
jgi:hypothetical protein